MYVVCVCVCVRVCFSMITAGKLPDIMKNIFAWLWEGEREGGREGRRKLASLPASAQASGRPPRGMHTATPRLDSVSVPPTIELTSLHSRA